MAKGNVIVGGYIETNRIQEAHQRIKAIVDCYNDVTRDVHEITNTVKENWVGKGRNEFESQYKLLIGKIDDFGDSLLELYEALVKAEAEYQTTDDSARQDFVMSKQEMEG